MAEDASEMSSDARFGWWTGRRPLIVAVTATALLVSCVAVSLAGVRSAAATERAAERNSTLIRATTVLLVDVEAAESGQRGFLLTDRASYLNQYDSMRGDIAAQLHTITLTGAPEDRAVVHRLAGLVRQKQQELEETIALRRSRGLPAALAVVNSDLGKTLMSDLAVGIGQLQRASQARLQAQDASEHRARAATVASAVAATLLALGLLLFLLWALRQRRALASSHREIARARDALRGQLSQLATHDPLTGLPNRRLIVDRLQQAVLLARTETFVAVMLVDLDRFRQINDQHGHLHGDRVLIEAARRLRAALLPGDTLGRVGGDQFVAVCQGLTSRAEGAALADSLHAAASADLLRTAVSASVGLAYADEVLPAAVLAATSADGEREAILSEVSGELLAAAEEAMLRAKTLGRDRVAIYDHGVASARHRRRRDVTDLAQAFDRDDLWMAYQPIIDLRTDRIVGVEALMRWTHPEHGPIPPQEFIATAEDTDLIHVLGVFALRTACEQLAGWNALRRSQGQVPMTMAVNVSGVQLARPDFATTVHQVLTETRTEPRLLCLEVTESVLVDATSASAGALDHVSELGVQLALDDFGTGYSSLTYLRRFPIDTIKIDRSFVAGMTQDSQDHAIVSAIIGLARTLGRDTVAEGIEHPRQADQLRRLGCRHAQGFLYAKALPALDLEALLLDRRPSWAGRQ